MKYHLHGHIIWSHSTSPHHATIRHRRDAIVILNQEGFNNTLSGTVTTIKKLVNDQFLKNARFRPSPGYSQSLSRRFFGANQKLAKSWKIRRGFSSPEWTLPRVNRSDPDIFGMKLDVFHLVANKVASDISNRGGFLPVAKPLRIE